MKRLALVATAATIVAFADTAQAQTLVYQTGRTHLSRGVSARQPALQRIHRHRLRANMSASAKRQRALQARVRSQMRDPVRYRARSRRSAQTTQRVATVIQRRKARIGRPSLRQIPKPGVRIVKRRLASEAERRRPHHRPSIR